MGVGVREGVEVGVPGVGDEIVVGAGVDVRVGVAVGAGVGERVGVRVTDGVGVGPAGVGVRLAVGEGIGISPVKIRMCSSAISRITRSGHSRAKIHSQF